MNSDNIQYVRIVLTKKCNMSCSFCHQEGCEYSSKDIEFEFLIDTVQKLNFLGYRKVKLMGGEPMLYPEIMNTIKSIRVINPDIDLSMISNCSAPAKRYLELFENGLDRLNISVHGWTYDYFYQNTGNRREVFELIHSNLKTLLAERKINKINYVIKKGINESDFYEMIESVKEYGAVVDLLNLLTFPEQDDMLKYQYSYDEIETLIRDKWDIDESIHFNNPYSLPSKRLILKNGCTINLKVNHLNEQNIFQSCKTCALKKYCIEGIKAIRLTNDGFIQPCLLRNDNKLNLSENNQTEYIRKYLKNL